MSIEKTPTVQSRERIPLHRRIFEAAAGSRAVRAYFEDVQRWRLLTHEEAREAPFGKETDVEALVSTPMAQELLGNDGEATYLVHGTMDANVEGILQNGLTLEKLIGPDVPNLRDTTKMMPSRDERGAEERIVHGITYRFMGWSGVKIVIKLDTPNPGTSLNRDQFTGTSLSSVDGHNIAETGDPQRPFVIPPEHILGYFDLDKGIFVDNPFAKQEESNPTLI